MDVGEFVCDSIGLYTTAGADCQSASKQHADTFTYNVSPGGRASVCANHHTAGELDCHDGSLRMRDERLLNESSCELRDDMTTHTEVDFTMLEMLYIYRVDVGHLDDSDGDGEE